MGLNNYAYLVLFIALAVGFGCGKAKDVGNGPESVNESSETEEAIEETGKTTDDYEPGDPLSAYENSEMKRLRDEGYPVYEKNVTTCTGVTSPSSGDFTIIITDDEKDEVVGFYVNNGGTPERFNDTVLFRDWSHPIGVSANETGGTTITYDIFDTVFSTKDIVGYSPSEEEIMEKLTAYGCPVYKDNVVSIKSYGQPNAGEYYGIVTRDTPEVVERFFVDAGGMSEGDAGDTSIKGWIIPIYIMIDYGATIIYYGNQH